jgi:hypothetical protein
MEKRKKDSKIFPKCRRPASSTGEGDQLVRELLCFLSRVDYSRLLSSEEPEELLTRLADDPASAALLRELGGRPDFNSDMAASRINTFSAIAAMPSFNCSSSVFFAMITSPS